MRTVDCNAGSPPVRIALLHALLGVLEEVESLDGAIAFAMRFGEPGQITLSVDGAGRKPEIECTFGVDDLASQLLRLRRSM